MTQGCAPLALAHPVTTRDTPCGSDPQRENRELRAELEALEPVVSAAVLTATAFRLRDHDALISALRVLVRAVRDLEEHRARA